MLDKNLDLILGRTEQYSKMLAANLQAPGEDEEPNASARATPGPGTSPGPSQPEPAGGRKSVRFKEEEAGGSGSRGGSAAGASGGTGVDESVGLEQRGAGEAGSGGEEGDDGEDEGMAGLLKRPREDEGSEDGDGGAGPSSPRGARPRGAKRARGVAPEPVAASATPAAASVALVAASAAPAAAATPPPDEDEYDAGVCVCVGGANACFGLGGLGRRVLMTFCWDATLFGTGPEVSSGSSAHFAPLALASLTQLYARMGARERCIEQDCRPLALALKPTTLFPSSSTCKWEGGV